MSYVIVITKKLGNFKTKKEAEDYASYSCLPEDEDEHYDIVKEKED